MTKQEKIYNIISRTIQGRTYKKQIGCLTREIHFVVTKYGIRCAIIDTTKNSPRETFKMRNFNFTKKYVTYEDLVKRIESYYRVSEENIIL